MKNNTCPSLGTMSHSLKLILLVCECLCFIDAAINDGDNLELTYNVTSYNHCLKDDNRFQVYVGRDLGSCVTECGLRQHCLALTYHGPSSICELFNIEDGDHVTNYGCIFIQKMDINIIQVKIIMIVI